MSFSPQLLARVFGVCFLLSFLSYGIGIGFLEIPIDEPLTPSSAPVIGGFLVVFCHTVFNLALLLSMYFLLKKNNELIALFYLILGGVSTILLALGGIFLLSFHGVKALDYPYPDQLSLYISQANFFSYQFGMAIWVIGGMMMCYMLLSRPLLPLFFPYWGLIGYFVFLIGCLLEIFNMPYGLYFSIPGGLFEIVISIWLILKAVPKTPSIKPDAVSFS